MMGGIWLRGKGKAIHKIMAVETWRDWNLEEWRHLSGLSCHSQWRDVEMMIGVEAWAMGGPSGCVLGLQWGGLVIKQHQVSYLVFYFRFWKVTFICCHWYYSKWCWHSLTWEMLCPFHLLSVAFMTPMPAGSTSWSLETQQRAETGCLP